MQQRRIRYFRLKFRRSMCFAMGRQWNGPQYQLILLAMLWWLGLSARANDHK